MKGEPTIRYRFARFSLDASTLELFEDGRGVHLPRLPASLLRLLLENAGRVVTREAIRRACWPETEFGVDAAINAAIRQVRRALGESATAARFIETFPRRGYRFAAPVRIVPNVRRARGRLAWLPRGRRALSALALLALAIVVEPRRPKVTSTVADLRAPDRLAYERAFLQLEARDGERLRQARDLFASLTAKAPDLAAAWSGLAEARFLLGDRAGARLAALDALRLDAEHAGAHYTLGLVKLAQDWDFEGAESSLRRAVALEPAALRYQVSLAYALISIGDLPEARVVLDRIYAADPVRFAVRSDAGWMEYLVGRFDRASMLCAAAVEIAPDDVWSEDCATVSLIRLGRDQEAMARIVAALGRWELESGARSWSEGETVRARIDAYWRWRADRLEAMGAEGWRHYRLATIYADLARPEDALRALEAAATARSMAVVVARSEPAFAALRGQPRFEALLPRGRYGPRS